MKLLTVIGTRPEAIKMAPVLDAIETCPDVTSRLCVTGQHRDLLDQALMFFDMRPDLDLGLMSAGQSLNGFFARAMAGLGRVLDEEAPNRVIVQGDTASALAGALAAFQRRIPVSHVEAGLRTFDTGNPWPEEGYRQAIDTIADQLFAPTATAAANLRVSAEQSVFVTGNSGIDAVHSVLGRLSRDRELRQAADAAVPALPSDRPLLLATIHRRESFGEPFAEDLRRPRPNCWEPSPYRVARPPKSGGRGACQFNSERSRGHDSARPPPLPDHASADATCRLDPHRLRRGAGGGGNARQADAGTEDRD